MAFTENIISAKKNKAAIKKANKLFKSMTPAQRRVAIARDVIAQINAEKFVAKRDMYVRLNKARDLIDEDKLYDSDIKERKEESDRELQEIINSTESCNVCARGALFLSACRKFNNLTIGKALDTGLLEPHCNNIVIDLRNDTEYERKFFSKEQSVLIETAFEGYLVKGSISDKDEWAAKAFHSSYVNSNDCLIAIMKNIIKNKGKFIIPKKYYYTEWE